MLGEHGPDRALLQQVWALSHARGFYGMTLPQPLGGAGFSLVDHVLVKEPGTQERISLFREVRIELDPSRLLALNASAAK